MSKTQSVQRIAFQTFRFISRSSVQILFKWQKLCSKYRHFVMAQAFCGKDRHSYSNNRPQILEKI